MKKLTSFFLMMVVIITLGSMNTAKAATGPSTSAPTPPTRSSAKVISIFSDAYTNVSGTDFNPWWGQSTVVTTVQIGADNILKYATLNYQGTQLNGSVNASSMNKLHIDVWSADATTFQITPISPGPKEFLYTCTPLNLNTWNSYDIDLTSFTGVDMSGVFQFKVVGNGTVFLDNLYFYDSTSAVDSQAPTGFTATMGTVTSDAVELLLTATDNSGAVNFEVTYGNTTLTVGGVSGVQKSYTISGLSPSTAYSFSVVAKDPTGNTASNSPVVVQATTAAAIPASPVSTALASNVLSVYSDLYTASATNQQYQVWWNAGWSDATLAGGGAAKKIVSTGGGGGCGIQFDNLDVSAMLYFHIDVYPTTSVISALKYNVVPVGGGGAGWTSFASLTANQWNSLDIPITALGLPGTSVFQVGIGSFGGDGTWYIDNVFFSKTISTGLNKIESNVDVHCFPNPVANTLNVSAQSEISEITVRNLLGQCVKSVVVNASSKSIDLSDIAGGNYYVSVKLANGQLATQKFAKQ